MHETLEDQIQRIVASMESEEPNDKEQDVPGTTEQETQPEETIHIHYFPDAIVIVKEDNNNPQTDNTVETTLAQTKMPSVFIAYATCVFYLFLILSCIAFQVYVIINPPIATVTIVPKTQTVTLIGTLQLGRLLNPLTLSQSQTVQTTGKGHQDTRSAAGFITFYNGQLNSVTVPGGTILTASNGVQVITEQDALIPAASPPIEGQVTVSAHALNPGVGGNIGIGEINQSCCAIAVLAKNFTPFTGGQDERDFQTVAKKDIFTASSPLKTAIGQSMQAALQGQLRSGEALQLLPCTPTTITDHQPGEEARQVKVTVSQTCSAVAYTSQAFEERVKTLLSTQARQKLDTGYSLIENVQVDVTQATFSHTTTPLVFLSFHAQGTWIYGLSYTVQQHIKSVIAGKTKQQAVHRLLSLPGVAQASISWGDDTRLPKDTGYIHITLFVV